MIQQFITFFFAGTDTSSHLVLWTLYHLSIDQQLQEEIREEVKQHYSE
jgi:cytochrome P450 family 4 subfamily V